MADKANVCPSGKLNLQGVFDRIYAEKLPARHKEFSLVVAITFPVNEFGKKYKFCVKLLEDDGKVAYELKNDSQQVPRPENRTECDLNLIFQLENMVFEKYGNYTWKIEINDMTQDRDYSFTISEAPEA